MANVDARFGLRPVSMITGAPYVPNLQPMYIPASYGTALFVGDPVVITGTANTAYENFIGASGEPGVMPEINKATAGAGNLIDGVIVAFAASDRDSTRSSAASTEGVALVERNPYVIWEIQEDGVGATIAATDIGLNADLVYTHAGDATYGQSGAELDISTKNTTANLQLKILGLAPIPNNELAANAVVRVLINQHALKDSAGVAGV